MTTTGRLWTVRAAARSVHLVGANVVEVIPAAMGSVDVTALAAERVVRAILDGIALPRRQ
jgi:arginase family enzyme